MSEMVRLCSQTGIMLDWLYRGSMLGMDAKFGMRLARIAGGNDVTAQIGRLNPACGPVCAAKNPRSRANSTTDLIPGDYLGTPEGYMGSYLKATNQRPLPPTMIEIHTACRSFATQEPQSSPLVDLIQQKHAAGLAKTYHIGRTRPGVRLYPLAQPLAERLDTPQTFHQFLIFGCGADPQKWAHVVCRAVDGRSHAGGDAAA